MKGLRRQEAKLLEHYAWVDKNAGTVRIPVERAIELLAAKGCRTARQRLRRPARLAAAAAPPPRSARRGTQAPATDSDERRVTVTSTK